MLVCGSRSISTSISSRGSSSRRSSRSRSRRSSLTCLVQNHALLVALNLSCIKHFCVIIAKAGKGVLYLYRTGVLYRVVIKFRVIGGSITQSMTQRKKLIMSLERVHVHCIQ